MLSCSPGIYLQEFQVRWKDHNGPLANHTTMKVYLDGHIAGKTHCSPGASNKRLGIRTASVDTYQPYQFSDLQTTGASSPSLPFPRAPFLHPGKHSRSHSGSWLCGWEQTKTARSGLRRSWGRSSSM